MKHYLRYISLIALLTLSSLLGGCASPVFQARVTTYQNWTHNDSNSGSMVYAFNHIDGQEVSLAQATYEDMVRPYLENAGFSELSNSELTQPRYLISINIDANEKERLASTPVYSAPPSPVFVPGYYNRRTGVRHSGYWAYPYGMGPQYIGNQVNTQNYLDVRLTIAIRDTEVLNEQGLPRAVYETTAFTQSTSKTLLQLIPLLAQAALSDFPAPNGSEHIVSIELIEPR